MKSIKGIIIGLLIFGAIVGGIIFMQYNKKVADPETTKTEATYRMQDLMQMEEAAISALNNQTIAVAGIVWAVSSDETHGTVTLGTDEMNSIICQLDNRHLALATQLNKGHFVVIKGTMAGYDFDDMLGKTIQLKNCAKTQ